MKRPGKNLKDSTCFGSLPVGTTNFSTFNFAPEREMSKLVLLNHLKMHFPFFFFWTDRALLLKNTWVWLQERTCQHCYTVSRACWRRHLAEAVSQWSIFLQRSSNCIPTALLVDSLWCMFTPSSTLICLGYHLMSVAGSSCACTWDSAPRVRMLCW